MRFIVNLNHCIFPVSDVNAIATNFPPKRRHLNWTVVLRHRQRVIQGIQQRGLPLLLYALSHVHSADAHCAHM